MEISIVRHPNPFAQSFYSKEVDLSESGQILFFRAPLPSQPREGDFRKFRLTGATGEALVRELCQIPGVTQVFLSHDHFTVLIRDNGNLSWRDLEPNIFRAFGKVFPSEGLFEWRYFHPSG